MKAGRVTRLALLALAADVALVSAASPALESELAWRFHAASGACEIACVAPHTSQVFVTVGDGVDIVDLATGKWMGSIARPAGFKPTSVASSQARLAIAWAAELKDKPGQVAVYQLVEGQPPAPVRTFEVGYLPDMLVFSPDGHYLVVANEGEPSDDYAIDPSGSITVVDMADGVAAATSRQAAFTEFDCQRDALRAGGVRIFGPSRTHDDCQATVAEDLEPEYIAISPDSRWAWVTLQENNALAVVDLAKCQVIGIHPLGLLDYRRSPANAATGSAVRLTGLDTSDTDGGACIRHWPVKGMYQPDGIAIVAQGSEQYLLTVNEGDPRRYSGFDERCEARSLAAKGLGLDERLKARLLLADDQLGRLEVSTAGGDLDGDGDLDELWCFGTRSFSVWRLVGRRPPVRVFDSGHDFEWVTAREAAGRYNADSTPEGVPDECSPKRGPEPESLAVGAVGKRMVAAIGLEKTGGAMLYEVTEPAAPVFLKYLPALDEDGVVDFAPEGLMMVPAEASPLGKAMLVLSHEKSGTMTAYTLAW